MAENPYLNPSMPLERVRADALHGVALARIAWRARDPDGAARAFGQIVQAVPMNETESAEVTNDE